MNAQVRQKGFTMIELLAVIGVIAVLSGIAFKLVSMASRQAKKAQTITKIEKISNVINEFYAEYGCYPPTDKTWYMYPPSKPVRILYSEASKLFEYGLASYLETRDRFTAQEYDSVRDRIKDRTTYLGDTPRDVVAKDRWKRFLEGTEAQTPPFSLPTERYQEPDMSGSYIYTNNVVTYLDGWLAELKYKSDPPYQTYQLYSVGPDGADGTADDIHRATWDNK